jgi:hypothetical protein
MEITCLKVGLSKLPNKKLTEVNLQLEDTKTYSVCII